MKFAEINKKFTEKVAEYIGKGYTINAATMNGSQGEIAKIDLTDGVDIVRIMLYKGRHSRCFYDVIELTVRIAWRSPSIVPNSSDTWGTLWHDKCDVIYSEEFCKVSNRGNDDWYVSREDAEKAYEKMIGRYESRYTVRKDITERSGRIALRFVRRQNRCKSARLEDVKVTKGDEGYRISYKDHVWVLK